MRHLLTALLALAVLTVVGCGSPPEAEMAAAQQALNSARAAEAEQYAPDAFRMLSDSLNAAMALKEEQDSKFALFRGYGDAKSSFERIPALAQEVVTVAATEKQKVREEVEASLANVKGMLDQAVTALEKAPRGKDTRAELELIKSELASLQAALSAAESDYQQGKYLVAKSKLASVGANVQKVTDEIAQASKKR